MATAVVALRGHIARVADEEGDRSEDAEPPTSVGGAASAKSQEGGRSGSPANEAPRASAETAKAAGGEIAGKSEEIKKDTLKKPGGADSAALSPEPAPDVNSGSCDNARVQQDSTGSSAASQIPATMGAASPEKSNAVENGGAAAGGPSANDESSGRNVRGKWTWTGVWAFGNMIYEDPKQTPGPVAQVHQPFLYTWDSAINPGELEVPSTSVYHWHHNLVKIRQNQQRQQQRRDQGGLNSPATPSGTPTTPGAEAGHEKVGVGANPTNPGAATATSKNGNPAENDTTENAKSAQKSLPPSRVTPSNSGNEASKPPPQDATKMPSNSLGATPKSSPSANQYQGNNDSSNAGKSNSSSSLSLKIQLPDAPITFASLMPGDPPFTDAAKIHGDDFPPSGRWKGSFQNATGRNLDIIQKVGEEFYLFFNAKPGPAHTASFVKDATGLTLKPGAVHVRGRGKNQYGEFDIVGSLDIATGILECQRQYVFPPSGGGSPRRSSLRSVSTRQLNRSYQTRKRPSAQSESSKRKSVTISPGLEGESPRRSGKKRTKSMDISNVSAPPMVGMIGSTGAMSPRSSSITNGKSFRNGTANASTSPASAGKRKRPPSGRSSSEEAAPSAVAAAAAAAAASTSLSLPDAPDPYFARWRAAHFLYYQRHDPAPVTEDAENAATGKDGKAPGQKGASSSPQNGGASSAPPLATPSTPRYVVYEGDMLNSERHGRGICLYNNSMLYEGEWRGNKEHGRGVLRTADRRRIIYEGQFERGRLQGIGTYYYAQAENSVTLSDGDDSDLGSRYEGDFRENLRHGYGKYVLPDGSVYIGLWRDGLMSGRGMFTWPDGSTYDGDWKDGKRNGHGILNASDGFVYDGAWVNNSMEGKGYATYPSGQRYEGIFSGGRREGRGTVYFTNGAVYEGRFRNDAIDGQGTMKMTRVTEVSGRDDGENPENAEQSEAPNEKKDYMIPISFHSDISHVHSKAGFTAAGE